MTSAVRPEDELANLITHGLGFVLSLIGAGYLLCRVADRPFTLQLAVGVYAFTLVLLYGCSTLSHAFHDLRRREQFRMYDQASIFLLMAGSYTPFAAAYFPQGAWLWLGMLVVMWALAVWGVLRVWQVRDLSSFDKLAFGVMGCLPIICLPELSRLAPKQVLLWVLAGGACYVIGLPFFCWSAARRYSHAVWHLCVIAGSTGHFLAIVLAVSERGLLASRIP